MRKNYKIILSILIIFVVMFVIPLIITNLNTRNDVGWLIMLLLILNPLASLFLGLLSGTNIKKLWFFPILLPILFLICYFIVLQDIILELIIYAIIYLIIGVISMFITSYFKKGKNKWKSLLFIFYLE